MVAAATGSEAMAERDTLCELLGADWRTVEAVARETDDLAALLAWTWPDESGAEELAARVRAELERDA